MIKLDIYKIDFLPSLFEEKPELLNEILTLDLSAMKNTCDELEYHQNMRKLYTKCNCAHNDDFIWTDTKIKGNDVDIFYCGQCGNWSISVTY